MSRAHAVKFALSLVALLVLGQLQCVAACVSFFSCQAADQSLPPCHRHHDSKNSNNSSSDSCSHEIASAGIVTQTVSSTAVPQIAPMPIALPLRLAHTHLYHPAAVHAASPGSDPPSILRV
jgi:hypothetical protein